jgi:hypothetical protein
MRNGRRRGPESSTAPSALTVMPTMAGAIGRRQMEKTATSQNGST